MTSWPFDIATPADLLVRQAALREDEVFVQFQDGSDLTFGGVADLAARHVAGLEALGVQPGDHLASWQPNDRRAVRDFFGNLAAGVVHTPMNVSYRGSILEHALNLSGATVMTAHPELVSRLDGLHLLHLRFVVTDAAAVESAPEGVTLIDEREFLSGRADLTGSKARGPWDPVAMVLTSGTTGPSKGVLHSLAYYEVLSKDFVGHVTGEDRYYHCLPPFHQGALVAQYAMLREGGSLFVRDGFRVGDFWAEARSSGSTTGLLIGGMANVLMKEPPDEADADNPLRNVLIVPLTEDFEKFESRFGVSVGTCYGMTEIGVPFSSSRPGNGHTCGELNEGFEVRLVDSHDLPISSADTSGELVVRHQLPWALNSGYKDMAEATATAWRNGWFHTGDAFKRDGSGNFYYVDRIKDSIRRRGENISSIEVEQEVITHPSVREAAAVGVPSETVDDEVLVVVSLQPGEQLDPVDLVTYLIERLPHFMVPRYIQVMDDLPKTATAKVRKSELRKLPLDSMFDREAAGIRVRREALP